MKAITTQGYGDVSTLQLDNIDKPTISENEILVKISAFSVNPVDWKIRSGKLKIKTGAKPPLVLGSDFAGEVIERGKNISEFSINDKVWGKVDSFKGGAYAEYIKVKPNNITKIPNSLDYVQTASIPNVGLTAYQALFKQAKLKEQSRVLINGASGGVGIMAVQIAKAYDCHVTAVCSAKNSAFVKTLGADVVLDYNKQDILKDNDSYHVFFDSVANQSLLKVKHTLKKGGAYVRTAPNLETLLLSPILKLFTGKSSKHIMVQPNSSDLLELKTLIESKKLVPVVEKTFAFEDIAQAHTLSESGRVVGKIVITF